MANNGIMTLDDLINGGILRSSLAADILKASVERAILNNPAIVRTFTGGDLEYKLGFMSATAVEEGVPEGQAVAIETPEFSSLSVPLSKDVVNVAITDEARIRSQSSGYLNLVILTIIHMNPVVLVNPHFGAGDVFVVVVVAHPAIVEKYAADVACIVVIDL